MGEIRGENAEIFHANKPNIACNSKTLLHQRNHILEAATVSLDGYRIKLYLSVLFQIHQEFTCKRYSKICLFEFASN